MASTNLGCTMALNSVRNIEKEADSSFSAHFSCKEVIH